MYLNSNLAWGGLGYAQKILYWLWEVKRAYSQMFILQWYMHNNANLGWKSINLTFEETRSNATRTEKTYTFHADTVLGHGYTSFRERVTNSCSASSVIKEQSVLIMYTKGCVFVYCKHSSRWQSTKRLLGEIFLMKTLNSLCVSPVFEHKYSAELCGKLFDWHGGGSTAQTERHSRHTKSNNYLECSFVIRCITKPSLVMWLYEIDWFHWPRRLVTGIRHVEQAALLARSRFI